MKKVGHAHKAPIRFADREPIEQILEGASSSHYGIRSLIHELVQSEFVLEQIGGTRACASGA